MLLSPAHFADALSLLLDEAEGASSSSPRTTQQQQRPSREKRETIMHLATNMLELRRGAVFWRSTGFSSFHAIVSFPDSGNACTTVATSSGGNGGGSANQFRVDHVLRSERSVEESGSHLEVRELQSSSDKSNGTFVEEVQLLVAS